MIKHIKRNTDVSGAIRKAQSTFMQAVIFPAIEDARQACAKVDRIPYMPEIVESDQVDYIDSDFASIWEGRA